MNHLRVHIMLEEMVKAVLNDQPGFVRLGNVWMEWDGQSLTWDVPLCQWDSDAVWRSLMELSSDNPEVERIADCAQNLANL